MVIAFLFLNWEDEAGKAAERCTREEEDENDFVHQALLPSRTDEA